MCCSVPVVAPYQAGARHIPSLPRSCGRRAGGTQCPGWEPSPHLAPAIEATGRGEATSEPGSVDSRQPCSGSSCSWMAVGTLDFSLGLRLPGEELVGEWPKVRDYARHRGGGGCRH